MDKPIGPTLFLGDGQPVTPGLYVRDGLTLLKISTPYPDEERSTATVCMVKGELLNRTTVRSYNAGQLRGMRVAGNTMIAKYHALLDRS